MANLKIPKIVYPKAKTVCVKFKDKLEFKNGIKMINAIKRNLKYYLDDTDIEGNIVISLSEHKHYCYYPSTIKTGAKGRPKIVSFEPKTLKGFWKRDPHIHGIINVNKNSKVSKMVKEYVNKSLPPHYPPKFKNIDESKGGYTGAIGYIEGQTKDIRTIEFKKK